LPKNRLCDRLLSYLGSILRIYCGQMATPIWPIRTV